MSLFNLGAIANPVAMIANVGTSLLNYKSQQDTNKLNEHLAQRANDANVALWREQSAYNTPLNQVQRLRDAGLNPMLAYGTVAESRAASAPSMQPAHMQAPQVDKFSLADYQQVINMQEQNALTRSQNAKVVQDTLSSQVDTATKAYILKMYKKHGIIPGDSGFIKTMSRFPNAVQSTIEGAVSKAIAPAKLSLDLYKKHVGMPYVRVQDRFINYLKSKIFRR